MKLIEKFKGGKKFSNTPTGRAMQRQYDKEQGIVMQRVIPETEVFPNYYDLNENGYGNSFAIDKDRRPKIFAQNGETTTPYTPLRLDEQNWLNRTLGINHFAIGLGNFIFNPSNVVPVGETIQGIKALASMSRGTAPVAIENEVAPKMITYAPRAEPKARLDLLERNPSRISEAERFGLPKVDRNNLSQTQQQALEDLALFRRSGLHRLTFRVTPNWEDFGWNLGPDNPTFMEQFAKDVGPHSKYWDRVHLETPTGTGIVLFSPKNNIAVYKSTSFPVPLGLRYAPGDARVTVEGSNYKAVMTPPRIDIQDFLTDLASDPSLLELYNSLMTLLPTTVNRLVVRDFWTNVKKVQKPGTYLSGDNAAPPLGSDLIDAFKRKLLYKVNLDTKPLIELKINRMGLSPDAYSNLVKTGNKNGTLRWGLDGFTLWNNSAVGNKNIYEAYELLMKGEITPDLYAEIFNPWAEKMGGRPVEWITRNGKMYPIHPHPYIFAKKKGGHLHKLI